MPAKLHKALEYAVQAHSGQDRDGAMPPPYACHPVEVMLNLRYIGGIADEDILATALLHDTIEETETTLNDIRDAFGDRVAALVKELTRTEPTSAQVDGLSKDAVWKVRAQMLLDEIAMMSPDAQIVKLGDRLSNVREARLAKSAAKFERYVGQTQRILAIIPRERSPKLWDAIHREVDQG